MVEVGDRLLIDFGKIRFTVLKIVNCKKDKPMSKPISANVS